jgi:hypothetical protein
MRAKPVYVVDLIKDVVTATNTAVIAELQSAKPFIQAINFIPGTEGEITDVLTLMSQQYTKDGKQWPLFALLMSFPENKAPEVGIDGSVELNIVIAMVSKPEDKTPDRYANNFKPVLYPIYLEFLNQVYLSGKFSVSTPDNIPHVKWDFPYYNSDKQVNVFNSYVDAIQIKIKLKILLSAVNRCV